MTRQVSRTLELHCNLLADGIELLDSRQYTMRIVLNVIHTTQNILTSDLKSNRV